MHEFTSTVMADATDLFTKQISSELEFHKAVSEESISKKELEMRDIKSRFETERDEFERKVRTSEMEKAELMAMEQTLKESVHYIQEEK